MSQRIRVYSDYKSPYAYLAKDLVYEMELETSVEIDWLPYTLDIPSYLGSATLGNDGTVVQQSRNAHQWRRVKYSYMDCRREANRRGLTLRGPQKIFDSRLAHIGMLFAQRSGAFRPYHDTVFERFWRRELDIEDIDAIQAVLNACGVDTSGFAGYVSGDGAEMLDRVQREAEAQGVFGVPSFLLDDGDLYWGREHLAAVRERLVSR